MEVVFYLFLVKNKNYLGLPNLVEFLELHKYSIPTDCYKLFCFWQILFFVCCLLILMHLWLVLSGMNHKNLEYSSFNTKINKEWVHYSTLSGGLFSYTNGAHEIFCLSFVLWSFQVLGKDLMDYGIRSGKSLSLGMPREGIPSFVFVHW